MFAGWTNVFMLMGAAASGLVGLLFIVSTLVGGIDPSRRARGLGLFLTPTVFKFSAVLALCVVAVAPGLPDPVERGLIALVGIVGAANLGGVTWGLKRGQWRQPLHWSDIWCYGVVPAGAFAGLVVLAGAADAVTAVRGVALIALSILLLAVRNAWDLVTAIGGGQPSAQETPQGDG